MDITILDHFKESLWQSEDKRYIVEQGGAGSGKAVPLTTKVITPDGYKLMGDIKIGDFVCNTYGEVSQVINKWDNTSRRIYTFTFEDGRTIECADNHQWVYSVNGGYFIEGNTRDISNALREGDVYIPLPDPVYFENPPEDVLPALQGIILGLDKDMKQDEISNIKKEDLIKYGIVKENGKVIRNLPTKYQRMSQKDRILLIYGFFAVCGSYDKESSWITLQIKSQSVAKKVRSIIWSLGGICHLRYSHINGKYNLKFDFQDERIKLTILSDKIEQNEIEYIQHQPPIGLRLVSVEYKANEPCQCIQVDQADHLYMIDDYIVTHNSAQICQRLCYLFLTRENMAFAVVRSTMPALTRSVYLGDPSIYKTLSDWGIPVNSWLNKTEATLRNPINGSVMYFIGLDDPEKIKSMNLNYIFIEEATEINADKWAQLNTRLRRYNPYGKNQMYIAYNPISYYNWVVQMFVANPDPLIKEDSVVHFSNFTQNPFVSLENVRGWFARAQQDESYYRTYIIGMPGQPLGLIYPNIHFTPSSTWPEQVWDQKPYYGIDWGFIDPMVLTECRDYDGKIYVRCLFYKTKTNTKDFLDYMDSLKISKTQNIYYDSADAERGSLLLQRGYTGFKAKKDILAGISYVKGFDIIVDSQGEFAEDQMNEVKAFAWQTDPDDSSKFIEKPEEGNEHFCDALRYPIVTEHMYNRNYGVASFDMDSVEDRLRKGGIYMPEVKEKRYEVY